MFDECLHLSLAEVAPARAGEPTSEALDPGYSDARVVHLDHRGGALQDPHVGLLQCGDDLVLAVGVVVVIAEYRDHRYT